MVRSEVVSENSSADAGDAEETGRVGHCGAVHALAIALAAYCAEQPGFGRAGHARDFAADAGFRGAGELLGATNSSPAHSGLRPEGAGSTVPDRGGGLGPGIATSGDARNDL